MSTFLVLGTSDSDGSHLAEQELAWPWLVAARIGEADAPVRVAHRRYYATAAGAPGYLERELAQVRPDVIALSITLYAFSVRTVANRVRRLAGKRAGRWVEARFNWFDRATAPSGGTGSRWRLAANRVAHRVARRVIGTASDATPRQVFEAYRQTIDRLAREEDARVVVLGSFPFTSEIERENWRARPFQLAFNRRMAQLCRERHIAWVDPEFMRMQDPDAPYSDALHFNEEAHERVAAAVLAALGR